MFEAWLNANKLDMKKVPYRNAVDAARDLAENRVQMYESAVAIAQPQIEAGKIKLLAVLNSVRTPAYPDIPTVAEAGHPALTIDGLVGLFGPPTMPMALREKIAADVKEVMESDPIIKDRLTRTGQAFNPGGPASSAPRSKRNAPRSRRRPPRSVFRPSNRSYASGGASGGERSSVRQPSAIVPWCCLPQCGHCTLIGNSDTFLRFSETSSIPDWIGLLV
jgi:hypothetical protein